MFSLHRLWFRQPRQFAARGMMMLVMLSLFAILHAQSLDKQISVSCHNVSLPAALKKVEKASGFKFIFAYDEVQQYKVSVNANKQPMRVVLQQMLKDVPFKYTVKDKFISITRTTDDRPFRQDTGVAASGATRTVKGYVRDADGEPLVGVPVCIGEVSIPSPFLWSRPC